MEIDIHTLIGEATAYDKKQMLEIKRPKSWLKSASAFVNSEGGILIKIIQLLYFKFCKCLLLAWV